MGMTVPSSLRIKGIFPLLTPATPTGVALCSVAAALAEPTAQGKGDKTVPNRNTPATTQE
ncbi:hypothetical protein AOE01nite_30260 [Acetobacter oeni]|uniref:Uncharacterized protein n=1 Tax=Acetobacter oeni TaxID=304077 RepID=A0A511XPA6_9PROT|nr:hypothetical protein AOE01nite_30260 [Acetobacter oeni]